MNHIETQIQVQGIRARMFRGGQGEPVMLLHGAAGLSRWTAFLETIASGFDLLVPEHPGFGTSDDPASIATIADLADYYLAAIETLRLPRLHLIGSSMGGWLAAEVAVRAPSLLASLTVIGPAGLRPRTAAPAPTPEEQTRRMFHNQQIVERILAEPLSDEQKRIQQKNRQTVAKLGAGSYCNPALEAALQDVKLPALVVWGDQDQIVPVEQAALWAQALPQAQTLIVEHSGHLPHYEHPTLVGEKILNFLKAV